MTIHYPLIVGGYHDGLRIEVDAALMTMRLPEDSGSYQTKCHDYDRTRFYANGDTFTMWVPHGQGYEGAVTLRKLLEGYNPKVPT